MSFLGLCVLSSVLLVVTSLLMRLHEPEVQAVPGKSALMMGESLMMVGVMRRNRMLRINQFSDIRLVSMYASLNTVK